MITWSGILCITTQHCLGNGDISLKDNQASFLEIRRYNESFIRVCFCVNILHVWHSCLHCTLRGWESGRKKKKKKWKLWTLQLQLSAEIRWCHGFMSLAEMLSDIGSSVSLGPSKKSSDETTREVWPPAALREGARGRGQRDEPWEITLQTGRSRIIAKIISYKDRRDKSEEIENSDSLQKHH